MPLTRLPALIEGLRARLAGPENGSLLDAIVVSGRLEPGHLSITMDRDALADQLGLPKALIAPEALELSGAFTKRRRGVETRLVLEDAPGAIDPIVPRVAPAQTITGHVVVRAVDAALGVLGLKRQLESSLQPASV